MDGLREFVKDTQVYRGASLLKYDKAIMIVNKEKLSINCKYIYIYIYIIYIERERDRHN